MTPAPDNPTAPTPPAAGGPSSPGPTEPQQSVRVGRSEVLPVLSHSDLRKARTCLLSLATAISTLGGLPALSDEVKPPKSMRLKLCVQQLRMGLDGVSDHDGVLAEAALVGFRSSGPLRSVCASLAVVEIAEAALNSLSRLSEGKAAGQLRRRQQRERVVILHRGLSKHQSHIEDWIARVITSLDLNDLRSRIGCEILRVERRRANPAPLLTDDELKGARLARLIYNMDGSLKRGAAEILVAMLQLEAKSPGKPHSLGAIVLRSGASLGTVKSYSPALQYVGLVQSHDKSGLSLTADGRNEAMVAPASKRRPPTGQSL